MSQRPPSMTLFPARRERAKEEHSTPARNFKKRGKQEFIMERFDKMANSRIEEHRNNGRSSNSEDSLTGTGVRPSGYRRPLKSISKTLAGSISNIDVVENMNLRHDNELVAAVEKLIKAEETARFTDMVVAAEAAVAAAPPDKAEEAALAVAHGYQTHTVSAIREEVPGDTIIEVIGYIGITRRKNADGKFCVC